MNFLFPILLNPSTATEDRSAGPSAHPMGFRTYALRGPSFHTLLSYPAASVKANNHWGKIK
uniref:Uncharacterized protein n=1 Tax=Bionectria ochroleuca TaxID=29856 RepID=A0A0B7KEP6_BIOOC